MRRVLAALLAVAVVGVAVAGCGNAVAPDEWTSSVCGSLAPWRSTITTLNQSAQAAMSSAHSPADARTDLLDLLDGAQHASEKARAAVADAGVPDVNGGAVIEKRFVASLASMRDAYGKAAATIKNLPTGDSDTFYSGVATALTTLNADYSASAIDGAALTSPELQSAFDKVAACR